MCKAGVECPSLLLMEVNQLSLETSQDLEFS